MFGPNFPVATNGVSRLLPSTLSDFGDDQNLPEDLTDETDVLPTISEVWTHEAYDCICTYDMYKYV
jgi:hypothetical protein